MEHFYRTADSGTSSVRDTYQVVINGICGGSYNIAHMQGDPFQVMALFHNRDLSLTVRQLHTSYSYSSWRTTVRPDRSSYFDSIRGLKRVLTGKQQLPKATGNWKPRVRLTIRGVESPDLSGDYILNDFKVYGGSWVNSSVNNSPVYPSLADGHFFFTYDSIRRYAIWYLENIGNGLILQKDSSGRHAYNDIQDLTIHDDCITYSNHVRRWVKPVKDKDGYAYHLNVKISPTVDGIGITLEREGIDRIYRLNNDFEYCPMNLDLPIRASTKVTSVVDYSEDDMSYQQITGDSRHTIIGATPILFHLQSQALHDALGDVSRNFETLVESPETLVLLGDIMNSPTAFPKKFKTLLGPYSRILFVIRLLMSGYLAYIFAIKPTYATLADVWQQSLVLPQEKYEKTEVYEGDNTAFMQLPPSMRGYIVSDLCNQDNVEYFKATFHTELALRLTSAYMARSLGSIVTALSAKGFEPSPLIIWQITPFSWVADRFVPMSTYIGDAYSFFKSFRSPITTIGHSVSIEIKVTNGTIYNIYLRSDNTTRPLDPSSQSWLTGSGLGGIKVPLTLISALGISHRSVRYKKKTKRKFF